MTKTNTANALPPPPHTQPVRHVVQVMLDHKTNHSLGYGFVRYEQIDSAVEAIRAMSGQRVSNKTLLCKFSNAAPQRPLEVVSTNLYIKVLILRL